MKLIYTSLIISALITRATHSCKTSEHGQEKTSEPSPSALSKPVAQPIPKESDHDEGGESEVVREPDPKNDDRDPNEHSKLEVTDIFEKRCKLKWKPLLLPKSVDPSSSHYKIYKVENIEGAEREFLGQIYVPGNPSELHFDVTGLNEDNSDGYYFEVEAVANSNVIETLKTKKAIVAQNPQDKPSRPLDPSIIKTKSGGHEMHWKRPKNPGRSEITRYVVQKSHNRNKDWKEFLTTHGPETSKEITLEPKDRFRVLAMNAAGLGEPSEVVYWNKKKYGCGHTKEVGGTVRRSTSSRTFTSWHDVPWDMHMQVSKQCVKSMGGEHPSFACAKSHQCGVMLVPVHDDLEESNVVVTTAQCVVKEGTKDHRFEMAAIRIIARVSHMSDQLLDSLTMNYKPSNEHEPIVYYVEDVLPHPDYNPDTLGNNIALVRLNQVIEFDDKTGMRAICRRKATDKTKAKENGLKKVQLSIHEGDKCRNIATRTKFSFENEKMFCGGGPEGVDHKFCLRDMGRGVACKPSNNKHDPWILCGLTNYLIPDLEDTCSQDAAFTSVYAHASWIDDEIVKFSKLFD